MKPFADLLDTHCCDTSICINWRGSFSVGSCMSNELSLGTNFINNNDCLRFGSWLKRRQSLLFMKLVPRESSFDMYKLWIVHSKCNYV